MTNLQASSSPSAAIQITREVCTTSDSMTASQTGQQSRTAVSAVSFPPQAHMRHSSIPVTPPPAYEGGSPPDAAAVEHLSNDDSFTSTTPPPPPPDYTKFAETTRAERCFYYGFLFFPIWIFGFMHFWATFSSTPQAMPLKDSRLPQWAESSIGLPTYYPHSTTTTSPSQKGFSWRRNSPPPSPSLTHLTSTTIMMNRPDVRSVWRKEERKWALRSGYAMTASWALLVMFLFICVQTGVFGFDFDS